MRGAAEWEYFVISICSELRTKGVDISDIDAQGELLDRIGSKGWELVTIIDTTAGIYAGRRRELLAYFKRELASLGNVNIHNHI